MFFLHTDLIHKNLEQTTSAIWTRTTFMVLWWQLLYGKKNVPPYIFHRIKKVILVWNGIRWNNYDSILIFWMNYPIKSMKGIPLGQMKKLSPCVECIMRRLNHRRRSLNKTLLHSSKCILICLCWLLTCVTTSSHFFKQPKLHLNPPMSDLEAFHVSRWQPDIADIYTGQALVLR